MSDKKKPRGPMESVCSFVAEIEKLLQALKEQQMSYFYLLETDQVCLDCDRVIAALRSAGNDPSALNRLQTFKAQIPTTFGPDYLRGLVEALKQYLSDQ